MNTDHKKKEIAGLLLHVLYLIFMTSIVFSSRAISSISIVAIFIAQLIINKPAIFPPFKSKFQLLFLSGCILLFLLQLVALLYTNDTQKGWSNIRIKTGLLITPLALFTSSFITATTREKLLSHYCIVLAIASLYCLGSASIRYLEAQDSSFFFYHSLVSPIHQHAVYFSLLVMAGLVFLLENISRSTLLLSRSFHISLTLFFSVFLFLLASKLVILFFLVYLFSWFTTIKKNDSTQKPVRVALLLLTLMVITLTFTIKNPISKRFYEIAKGNIKIVTHDSFKKSDYFNGLQFRLLQWKFVGEILTEKKRWLIGVSPGDAQATLNEKYLAKNMYSGETSRGDRGYLVYNTHNQFLQTVLQNGLIGLAVLMMICVPLLKLALQNKKKPGSFIILLLLAWLFTEAAFETQYGIVIFIFFSLFYQLDSQSSLLQTDGQYSTAILSLKPQHTPSKL